MGDTSGGWTFTLTVTGVIITQSSPNSGTVTNTASSGYANQLVTVGNGTVSYGETSSAYSGYVHVSPSGAVTTTSGFSAATYNVAGTDADSDSDSGTWAFTLTVTASNSGTPAPIPPAAPTGSTSSQGGTSSTSTGTATATNDSTTASGSGTGALTVA